jgi:hypothetical protein
VRWQNSGGGVQRCRLRAAGVPQLRRVPGRPQGHLCSHEWRRDLRVHHQQARFQLEQCVPMAEYGSKFKYCMLCWQLCGNALCMGRPSPVAAWTCISCEKGPVRLVLGGVCPVTTEHMSGGKAVWQGTSNRAACETARRTLCRRLQRLSRNFSWLLWSLDGSG